MSRKITLIGPKASIGAYIMEAWQYRRIALHLAWRDVLVRFKQTVLGVVWVLIRPLAVAAIFAFVFGKIAGLDTQGVPPVLFVLVAMLPWQFVMAVIGQGADSIIANAGMVTKIYFPRILLPLSTALGAAVDFIVALPVVAVLMVIFGFVPPASAILAVPLMLLLGIGATGVSAILAALNASYRDIRQIVPFVLQLAFFLSPIGYGTASVPEAYRSLYCLNPLVGLLEALRAVLLGLPLSIPVWAVIWSIVFCIVAAGLSVFVTARHEPSLVDVI